MWEQFLAMKWAELRLRAWEKERTQWWESLPSWEPATRNRRWQASLLALMAGAAGVVFLVLQLLG